MRLLIPLGLLALLGGGDAARGNTTMTRFLLPVASGGLCLDGTPGAYYFAPAAGPATATKWLMFFEGGGWCYNEMDCYGRSFGGLGSSSSYPPTITNPDYPDDGMCTINPEFCDYNRVWLPYCDGNSFSGNRPDAVPVRGRNLYFRGHVILSTVLSQLLANHNLAAATHFVLTGCSAGGLSTFIHTNFVGDFLVENARALVRYGSFPLSGFFLVQPNAAGAATYEPQIRYISQLSQARSGLDRRCVMDRESSGGVWTDCNFAQYSYPSTIYPIFPINSKFDSWQTACILGAVLPANFPNQTGTENGVCNGVSPSWNACQNNPYAGCNENDSHSMLKYQTFFDDTFTTSIAYRRRGNGAFIFNNHVHCWESGGGWLDAKVGGVAARDAVSAWWNSAATAPPEQNTHYCTKFYPDAC